ncbi:MAG: hypothetical protein WCA49_09150 [Candidatus Sulfotelmatobacter sp.]
MEERRSNAAKKSCLELKYCERCGGLWLRPAGGGQIYCVACGREVAELPPGSHERETERAPQEPQWGADGGEFEEDEDGAGMYLDATGGVE